MEKYECLYIYIVSDIYQIQAGHYLQNPLLDILSIKVYLPVTYVKQFSLAFTEKYM